MEIASQPLCMPSVARCCYGSIWFRYSQRSRCDYSSTLKSCISLYGLIGERLLLDGFSMCLGRLLVRRTDYLALMGVERLGFAGLELLSLL